jgi:hypothetical protein
MLLSGFIQAQAAIGLPCGHCSTPLMRLPSYGALPPASQTHSVWLYCKNNFLSIIQLSISLLREKKVMCSRIGSLRPETLILTFVCIISYDQ